MVDRRPPSGWLASILGFLVALVRLPRFKDGIGKTMQQRAETILRSEKTTVSVAFRLGHFTARKASNRKPNAIRRKTFRRAVRSLAPTLIAFSFDSIAHAQDTMAFS